MEKRILVVDDEIAIVAGLTAMFEFERIESAGAYDYDEAVAILGQSFCPVILTDLCLSTIAEGLRLIDTIRELSPRSRIAVLTGYATPAMEDEMLRRGVSIVLQKPAPTEVILDAINALLQELECAAGEVEVDLQRLYVSLRKKLYGISRVRFGLSHDAAEDVVQEAWLLFLQKRGFIRAAGPWLSGVVANLSRQQIDKRIRRRETDDEEALSALPDLRDGSLTDVLAVRQALGRVDDRARLLCSLIGMEGQSYEDVSSAAGMPVGSIGPLYIRAKKKLRQALSH